MDSCQPKPCLLFWPLCTASCQQTCLVYVTDGVCVCVSMLSGPNDPNLGFDHFHSALKVSYNEKEGHSSHILPRRGLSIHTGLWASPLCYSLRFICSPWSVCGTYSRMLWLYFCQWKQSQVDWFRGTIECKKIGAEMNLEVPPSPKYKTNFQWCIYSVPFTSSGLLRCYVFPRIFFCVYSFSLNFLCSQYCTRYWWSIWKPVDTTGPVAQSEWQ